MDAFAQILVLMAFLAGGALLARFGPCPGARAVDRLIATALRLLLLAMGFRIGNDPSLSARLGELGLLAAASAGLAVAGTLLFLLAALALGLIAAKSSAVPASEGADASDSMETGHVSVGPGGGAFKAPLLLLAVVVAGFLAGALLPPLGLDISLVTGWALNGLLFFIGMQFAQAGVSLRGTFLRRETLVVPLATALGSLAGGLLVAPLFGLSAGKALALAGGFGWYSLSGVLISDLGDPALGSAAFLANMIRESIALVAIPFLSASRLPALAVGVGGATAMDVTLPLIERGAGPAIVPLSFASGALLSLSVPFLVPFLLGLTSA